ncbi:MAG: DUF3090 family protein [Chloroflexota bacterium]|nr:DUF3090 family protein [Chloroflexota bacterium]
MAEQYDMHPVSRITVGTVGEPGNRTFFLQGVQGLESVALIIEKEQAVALAAAIEELLEDLEDRFELPPPRPERISALDLQLQMPVEGRFRTGQMGLGYDEARDLVMIAAQSLVPEEEEEPDVVRFWITRDQAAALGNHALEVAGQGRPICALCGEPIGPEGHFCPRSNGHGNE